MRVLINSKDRELVMISKNRVATIITYINKITRNFTIKTTMEVAQVPNKATSKIRSNNLVIATRDLFRKIMINMVKHHKLTKTNHMQLLISKKRSIIKTKSNNTNNNQKPRLTDQKFNQVIMSHRKSKFLVKAKKMQSIHFKIPKIRKL